MEASLFHSAQKERVVARVAAASVVVDQPQVSECVLAVVSFRFGVLRVAQVSDVVELALRGADERVQPLYSIRSAQRGLHPAGTTSTNQDDLEHVTGASETESHTVQSGPRKLGGIALA